MVLDKGLSGGFRPRDPVSQGLTFEALKSVFPGKWAPIVMNAMLHFDSWLFTYFNTKNLSHYSICHSAVPITLEDCVTGVGVAIGIAATLVDGLRQADHPLWTLLNKRLARHHLRCGSIQTVLDQVSCLCMRTSAFYTLLCIYLQINKRIGYGSVKTEPSIVLGGECRSASAALLVHHCMWAYEHTLRHFV